MKIKKIVGLIIGEIKLISKSLKSFCFLTGAIAEEKDENTIDYF
ncbi:hypothetical protein [Sutcliffiella horikoshii]|nr:hypothetical protein [Sutcliffiella horikoshii]